jgi:hypothetical protein
MFYGGYLYKKNIMAAKKKWVITISGERSISAVKKDITAQGFDVAEVLKEIGSITGTATDSAAKKIRSIPGIADLSEDPGEFSIGNPESPVTW